MPCLSQTAGYAIRMMAFMDGPDGRPLVVRDLADQTGIPKPYLSKIVHALATKDLVITKRGYKGGVMLSRDAREIAVLEVADAFDGPDWLDVCILGLNECTEERACPLHEFWKPMRARIHEMLSTKTLAEMADFEHWKGGVPG